MKLSALPRGGPGRWWRFAAALAAAAVAALSLSAIPSAQAVPPSGSTGPGQQTAGPAVGERRTGDRWGRPVRLADPAGKPNDGFGTAVGISADNLVVGAPGVGDYAGAAYFYGRSGSRWRAHGTVTVGRKADRAGGFGGAVAITGTGRTTTALIGGVSVSGLAFTRHRCGNANSQK